MKGRLPLVLSAVALVVAIVGTPASEGALQVVRTALFAKNAGAVNGVKASRAPRAGRLLPLNARGHFPSSVLAVPSGPQGVAGPPGIPGPPGIVRAYNYAFAEVMVTGTSTATLAKVALPAGKYMIAGYANLSNLGPTATSGACDLHVVGSAPLDNDDEDYYSLAPTGTAPWRKRLVLYLLYDFGTTGGQVEMTCHNDVGATVGSDWVKIAALQVDSLTSAYFPS
jgi:hypothetical protein